MPEFTTTQWSLVLAAGEETSTRSREALAALCRIYWPPVYSFIRARERDAENARDLTQGFFADLLERRGLGFARRERGRFRSFLLASAKNYLANQRKRAGAIKRGGGIVFTGVDLELAESRFAAERGGGDTPESIFEKRWALTLLERVLETLAEESDRAGKGQRFAKLRPYLISEEDAGYAQVATELSMSESAVKVAVHRLRRRFATLLRKEIACTVDGAAKVDEEIRYLLSVLGST